MLTATAIMIAKAFITYRNPSDILHEHDDCIRMSYEWLRAQKRVRGQQGFGIREVRSLIIHWAGSYVSADDVQVAASLLPGVDIGMRGGNISKRMTLPHDRRLIGISQAFRHPDKRSLLDDDLRRNRYKIFES